MDKYHHDALFCVLVKCSGPAVNVTLPRPLDYDYLTKKNLISVVISLLHTVRPVSILILVNTMEPNNSQGNETRSEQSGDKDSDSESKYLQERIKKVVVKPPSSPTSLLARNAVLLPSGVAKVKQLEVNENPAPSTSISTGSATGNPRNKTALAPGHSLMDWIRLGSSGVDLTGVGGVPRTVTTVELAKHDKRTDAWIAIRGIVYNVTRYMDFHPGGIPELMKGVGKDATKLFENVHAWVNYQSILQKCVVGRLSKLSSGSTEKNLNSKSVGTSNTSSGLLSSCTKKNEEAPAKNSSIVKMDWQQTSHSITFSYHIATGYHAVGYQLTRLSERKFRLILSFDKDIVTHELELNEDVNWPPRWSRNFETMDVDFTFTKKKGGTWKTYGSCMLLSEPKTKQRSYKDYKVISNTSLCENVNLLVLRANDYLELIPVGHHVEAKMLVMGMEVSRRYTPVPPCLHPEDMAPGYESDSLCLIVKRYPDGALSPSITSLKKGQTLTLSHALGTFVVENFDEFSTIHMLAAGTGLTAMLSIIQRALGRRNVTRMNLVCFNRNQANIFYSKQLKRVSNTYRLEVTHVLSQPDESWTGRRGTVSQELLKDLIGELSSQGCVFICGPEPFLKAAREELQKLGWKKSQIHEFDD